MCPWDWCSLGFFERLGGELDKTSHVVFRCRILGAGETATLAPMHDAVGFGGNYYTLGFHSAFAEGSSIPWILIHMLAPQTLRAVVGVSGSSYTDTAVIADKVFFCSSKTFHKEWFPPPFSASVEEEWRVFETRWWCYSCKEGCPLGRGGVMSPCQLKDFSLFVQEPFGYKLCENIIYSMVARMVRKVRGGNRALVCCLPKYRSAKLSS